MTGNRMPVFFTVSSTGKKRPHKTNPHKWLIISHYYSIVQIVGQRLLHMTRDQPIIYKGNMKKYLACALLASAFALNVQAQSTTDSLRVLRPVSVPDGGSTAALLGTAFLALAIASRRFGVR